MRRTWGTVRTRRGFGEGVIVTRASSGDVCAECGTMVCFGKRVCVCGSGNWIVLVREFGDMYGLCSIRFFRSDSKYPPSRSDAYSRIG
jgi:hypothetical protein